MHYEIRYKSGTKYDIFMNGRVVCRFESTDPHILAGIASVIKDLNYSRQSWTERRMAMESRVKGSRLITQVTDDKIPNTPGNNDAMMTFRKLWENIE